MPTPDKFALIMADPPWPEYGGGVSKRGADKHYKLMTVEEIKALGTQVQKLALPDSFLFLWATNNHLPAAIETVPAWGFRYVTNIVWCKPSIGLGHYLRGQHELCLIGIRGKPPYSLRPQGQGSVAGRIVHPSVLHTPKKKHSQKPESIIDVAETFSEGPYLELFARRLRLGWHSMGIETGTLLTPVDQQGLL